MNFEKLFMSIKKKFNQHPEIMLECEKLPIQITDTCNNAFYILWENNQCLLEPYHYHDYSVCITTSQHNIELLFTKQQYLFIAHKELNIKGSFEDVMAFQKLLSYVTGDSDYIMYEEIVSKMMLKQNIIQEDIGMIMKSLQLLITNSLISLPENYAKFPVSDETSKDSPKKRSYSKSDKTNKSRTRKKS